MILVDYDIVYNLNEGKFVEVIQFGYVYDDINEYRYFVLDVLNEFLVCVVLK